MEIKFLEDAFDEMLDFIAISPIAVDDFESDFGAAIFELEKIESDNVVEIVRYKDCKYLNDFECKFLKSRVGGKDFFCGLGARKED